MAEAARLSELFLAADRRALLREGRQSGAKADDEADHGITFMLPQPPLLCEHGQMRINGVVLGLVLFLAMAPGAQLDDATRTLSHDIFRQLIEINTTDSVGSTTLAA